MAAGGKKVMQWERPVYLQGPYAFRGMGQRSRRRPGVSAIESRWGRDFPPPS